MVHIIGKYETTVLLSTVLCSF